jgi:fumarate reductase subunit D
VRPVRVLLLLVAALAAWAAWLAEICWIKGWTGLGWVSSFNWSAILISGLVATTCSYVLTPRHDSRSRATFIIYISVLGLASFAAARWAAIEMFSSGIAVRAGFEPLVLLIAAVAVSLGLVVAANRFLTPVHLWTGILILVSLVLSVPLSFATIKIFPALNGSEDQIHAFKMGYPIFWIALLVPASLGLGRKRPASSHSQLP